MTIRLYQQNVDQLDFSAVVVSCEKREGGYAVVLDQTAFFPEGGGQGADHGTLEVAPNRLIRWMMYGFWMRTRSRARSSI